MNRVSAAPRLLLFLIVLQFAGHIEASQTRWWRHSNQKDFLAGELKGVSVTSDGRLTPSPGFDPISESGEAFVYDAIIDRANNLILGTGNNGRIFRVSANGESREWARLQEAGVFALAVDTQNRVYAATSPDGRIHRLDNAGQPEPFFDPKEKYIWSLAIDGQNNLYVGTGPQGKIYKVDSQGQGRVFYDSEESHIMVLKWDLDGNLLAGSSPNGLLIRVSAQGKPYVLYDSRLEEIKAIDVDRYGTVYAAALGGGTGLPGDSEAKPPVGSTDSPADSKKVSATGSKSGKGLEIYRIDREHLVETMYTSDDETAFDLMIRSDGNLLAATGPKGRILSISPSRFVTFLVQSPEEQVTSLIESDGRLYAATSNLGKLFELKAQAGDAGKYLSPVLDAGVPARWGTIRWRSSSSDSSARLYTRSGNTEKPDQTWGDWSEAYVEMEGSPISSAPARYLQYRLEFPRQGSGSSITSPSQSVEEIAVSYLQNNMAPRIRSLAVHPSGRAFAPIPENVAGGIPPGGPSGAHARSLPREMRRLNGSAARPQPRPIFIPAARSFSWDAVDPNGDDLIYSLFVRRQGENVWKPIIRDLQKKHYTLDGASIADGTYVVKVTASDRLSNPPDVSLEGEMVSRAFTISNSGPGLTLTPPQVSGRNATVQFTAQALIATLHQAEYQLDGGDWIVILPDDGITDGRSESYSLTLEGLAPGDRAISVRVIDSVGNIAARRETLRIR